MKIGIQLYSVKEHLQRDCTGTLHALSEMGYRYIEPFASSKWATGEREKGYGLGMERREAKAFLDGEGLRLAGGHYYGLGCPEFEDMCDYYAGLGADAIGCGGEVYLSGLDGAMRQIEAMVRDAEVAARYGLRYYYHNHFWEFCDRDGTTIERLIAENTPKDLVYFELDNFWACRGGANPVQVARELGSRLIRMHQKDFSRTAGEPLCVYDGILPRDAVVDWELHSKIRHTEIFAEVGNGVLPIQDFIDAGNAAGVEYMLLEQDLTALDELESVRISMEAFHKFKHIEWD